MQYLLMCADGLILSSGHQKYRWWQCLDGNLMQITRYADNFTFAVFEVWFNCRPCNTKFTCVHFYNNLIYCWRQRCYQTSIWWNWRISPVDGIDNYRSRFHSSVLNKNTMLTAICWDRTDSSNISGIGVKQHLMSSVQRQSIQYRWI
jgi:hypothetical protein